MAAPAKGLTLTAAYGHLDPKYLDVGGFAASTLDSHFQRTPRNSFSGSANYEMPFRPARRAAWRLQLPIEGAVPDPRRDQRSARLWPARRAGHVPGRGDRWSVALFGTQPDRPALPHSGPRHADRQAGLPIRASDCRARSASSWRRNFDDYLHRNEAFWRLAELTC